MDKKGILRVLDANFNRAKEGLRVVEDIFRYLFEDDKLRKKVRRLRHALDFVVKENFFKEAILSRDSNKDLGKNVDVLELRRKNCLDILYVNLQRVKESLRVLEEFFKIVSLKKVNNIKKIRYKLYDLEREITQWRTSLRNFR
ncbi:MAG TPA: thiamine-phosphate pyrophosphorylase [Candidatus Omnitrophica bacterium]|nr:thiamine-phosphate pyrophosphorylase [Candidatus Omnitrophota bacterium]